MANYTTPTVIDPVIPLANMLPFERMFLARVFDEEVIDEAAYYYSEDGARDTISLPVAQLRTALDSVDPGSGSLADRLLVELSDANPGEANIELEQCGALWPDVLQDIVRRSPDLDHLTVTVGYHCSKMRTDGFGGAAMVITAARIRWESTHCLLGRFYTEASAAGEIDHGNS